MLIRLLFLTCLVFAETGLAQSVHPIDLRGVHIWRQMQKIEVQGVVNMQQGLIELLATAPGGKDHESIFVLNCNPSLLHTGLLIIGMNPGSEGERGENLDGDGVYIYVRWQEGERMCRKRAEDCVWDQKHYRAMARCRWIFTGSRLVKDPQTEKVVFMANVNGSLAATFYDPDAILNNPHIERNDDTLYYANPGELPAKGTQVTLVFSAVPLD